MGYFPWIHKIFPKRRPLAWVLPIVLLIAGLAIQGFFPGWAERVELWTVDLRFVLRGAEQPQFPIVIVALDENSFQMLGNLNGENIRTWPRGRWAEFIAVLAKYQPRLIALDVVFDTPGWDAGGDEAFAQSMVHAGNVILAANLEQNEGDQYGNATYSPPVLKLYAGANTVGVGNLSGDVDGSIRKANLLWAWKDDVLPSFALVTAAQVRGTAIDVPKIDLYPDGSLAINFRGPEGTFQTISMIDVLENRVLKETLKDKIVLVGYTTLLEQDRHLTPFVGASGIPGVEIQANVLDTLLSGDWLHHPADWLPFLLVGVFILIATICGNLTSPGLGAGLFAISILGYVILGVILFNQEGFLLPLAAPLLTGIISWGIVSIERTIFVERDKRFLRQRFAGVMSPERLQSVLDNWEALLDPERPEKSAAVMFADIRGFTHATETLMREGRSPEMVRFLNAYLDKMSEVVFREGGVIYRTFGDGLLILFGVPEPLEDYCFRATRAAVGMALASEELHEIWPLKNEKPFQIGIGINEGKMMDAIIGRGRRFDYTVLGDPVNAASRIEGYCKEVMEVARPVGGEVPEMVTILMSAEMHEQIRGRALVDEGIPPFAARGKSEEVHVVRLLGIKEEYRGI